MILPSMILPEKAESRETSVESLSPAVIDTPLQDAHSEPGGHRHAATAASRMILSEQGADFFSKEVGGAEDKESGERPGERLREGNFADEDI